MRIPLGVVAVVALFAMPPAVANDAPRAPDILIVLTAPGAPSSLAWSPVPGADAYVIYRGSSHSDLAPYATTSEPWFIDGDATDEGLYGVATRAAGELSPIHASDGPRGDCVRANTQLHVTITVSNCVRT